MHKSIICVLIFFSCVRLFAFYQDVNPPNTKLFLQNEVARIDMIMDSSQFNWLISEGNEHSDAEFPATFIYTTSQGVDTVELVGFRLRGNTARYAEKKSFKISFNSFVQGQKYEQIEKINLNAYHNDVSLMRNVLSLNLLNEANLVASRNSYIQLFVNQEYRGIYSHVEHIDEEFVKARYSDTVGNLYKCFWGANLTYLGENAQAYTSVYELKTNENQSNYSDLIEFITVLNQTSDEEFACQLESIFDVHEYLKTLAIEVLIGHWDGYSVNNNNYYLYHSPVDNKFHFWEYDMDNTFGIDWFSINWSVRNPYEWAAENESRPLFTRIISHPYYKEQFTNYLEQYVQTIFTSSTIAQKASTIINLIGPYVETDFFYTLDYGFTPTDFGNAYSTAWGNHIPQSISEYVSSRIATLHVQLSHEIVTQPCILNTTSVKKNQPVLMYQTDLIGRKIDENYNGLKINVYENGQTTLSFE